MVPSGKDPTVASAGSDRDRVLQATDLVALIGEHIQLRPKGREHVGLCPFHDDRSPSMSVVTHKGDGFYKCFACGEAGNAIDFMMKYHHMDFGTALRHLAARGGIALEDRPEARRRGDEPTRDDLLEANAYAARFFRRVLQNAAAGAGSVAKAAVEARGIPEALVESFGLGAAPDHWDALGQTVTQRNLDRNAFVAAGLLKARSGSDRGEGGHYDTFRNRLIFPIHDELGRPIAFGARRLAPDDEPKYLNSPESPVFSKSRVLYGIHAARRAIVESETAIVCEGYTDVIACHRAGLVNVVATLGTALTREHARSLRRLGNRIVLLFDGDEAGQRAADRALEAFLAEPVEVAVCTLPDQLDPDELLSQPDGRARFDRAVASAEDALSHLVGRFRLSYRDASSMSGRQQRLEEMLGRLASMGFHAMSAVRRQFVIASLAQMTGIDDRTLLRAMPAARAPRPVAPVAVQSPQAASRERGASGAERTSDAGDGTVADHPDAGRASPSATASEQGVQRSLADALAGVPRDLVEAERRLLGLLLAHPELITNSVDAGEGFRLPVLELFPAESLVHEPHRALAGPLFEAADETRPISMQTLMSELVRGDLRSLASSLYMEASDRTAGRAEVALEMLTQTCSDLDAARVRHRTRKEMAATRTTQGAAAFAALIESRRERGADPTAFEPRSIR